MNGLRFSVFLVLVTTTVFSAVAQTPDTVWTHILDADGLISGQSVEQTSDGGFIVASRELMSSPRRTLLTKTDWQGTEIWSQLYDFGANSAGNDVKQTSDGGYIVAGYAGNNSLLLKTDSNGTTLWSNIYSFLQYNTLYDVYITSDGGYMASGSNHHGLPQIYEAFLIKTDPLGNLEWIQTYDDNHGGYGQPTSDGGYIIAGSTYIGTYASAWVLKTDQTGNAVWERTIGDGEDTSKSLYDIRQTSDGGYIGTGLYTSNPGSYTSHSDNYLLRLDESGDTIWERHFGGYYDDHALCVRETMSGGFIIAGYKEIDDYMIDSFIYIAKANSSGNVTWTWTYNYGYYHFNRASEVEQTSEGRYIAIADQYLGDSDCAWLIRLESDDPQPLVTITLTPYNTPIRIPASGGSFELDAFSTNALVNPAEGQVWTVVQLPNGNDYFSPLLYRATITFQPGETIVFNRLSQLVPTYAPAGIYVYKARAGYFPGLILAEAEFEFEKLDE